MWTMLIMYHWKLRENRDKLNISSQRKGTKSAIFHFNRRFRCIHMWLSFILNTYSYVFYVQIQTFFLFICCAIRLPLLKNPVLEKVEKNPSSSIGSTQEQTLRMTCSPQSFQRILFRMLSNPNMPLEVRDLRSCMRACVSLCVLRGSSVPGDDENTLPGGFCFFFAGVWIIVENLHTQTLVHARCAKCSRLGDF